MMKSLCPTPYPGRALLFALGMLAVLGGVAQAEEGAPARALLRIHAVPVTTPTVEPPAFNPGEYALYKATQAALIHEYPVLAPALDSQGMRSLDCLRDVDSKLAWIQEHVSVSFPGDSQIMAIEFSGGSARENQEILHAIVNSYLDNIVAAELRDEYAKLQYLRTQYTATERKCRELREEILETKRKAGAEESEDEALVAIGQLQLELEFAEATLAELNLAVERLARRVDQSSRVELLQPARSVEE